MKKIIFEGKEHSFPDDASDDEIRAALGGDKPLDFVGKAKAHLTEEPTAPRPDLLEMLTGKKSTDYLDLSKVGSGIRTVGRYMLPGSKGELARDVGMAAVPVASLLKPASRFLAPAVERTAYAGLQPLLETGDQDQALKQAGSVASLEALMGVLGLGKAAGAYLRNRQQAIPTAPPVAVHQAANFQQPLGPGGGTPPPIIFNRVNSGSTPTVRGGGGSSVTPTTVTVQPPRSGAPIFGGDSPAAILQEALPHPPRPATPPLFSDSAKAVVDIAGAQSPEEFGLPLGIGGLSKLRSLIPYIGEAARGAVH